MPKKKTYDEVKGVFEECGYTLLSKRYVNGKSKLSFICPEGHEGKITYGSFVSGCRCRVCSYVFRGNKFKSSIKYIRIHAEHRGYTLKSSYYKNAHSKIVLNCPEGHLWKTTWHSFRKGSKCLICCGNSVKSIDDVRINVNTYGYTVSGQYKNNRSTLLFECPKKHKWNTTWKSFNSGSRCPACGRLNVGKILSRDVKYIEHILESEGYTVLDITRYRNNKDKFLVRCKKGHELEVRWNDFQQGHRCPRCVVGPVSATSQKWLDSLDIPTLKREFCIKDLKIRVDGFDPKTNTVYEFLGDYWHGNPEIFATDQINPTNKKSFGLLYEKTLERIKVLKDCGYTVIYVWEKDYKNEGATL